MEIIASYINYAGYENQTELMAILVILAVLLQFCSAAIQHF